MRFPDLILYLLCIVGALAGYFLLYPPLSCVVMGLRDLSGFVVVCSSNIGSRQLLRPSRLPFTTLERAVLAELHRVFRPELIGRFDEKIIFKPLSPETQREIGILAIEEELGRLKEKGFELSMSEEAAELLVRKGMHKALGGSSHEGDCSEVHRRCAQGGAEVGKTRQREIGCVGAGG